MNRSSPAHWTPVRNFPGSFLSPPLARFDNYTVYHRSFNLFGRRRDERPTKINFYYWSGETDAASRSLLSFEYSPLPSKFREKENRFLSTRFIQGRRRGGRETIVLYLISYWYLSTMCTLIFRSRISNISRSMVGFSREFFHSKRNPLSFNYNIYISDKS